MSGRWVVATLDFLKIAAALLPFVPTARSIIAKRRKPPCDAKNE